MKLKVAVIGAGVVGASIARVLSMYEDFNVVLLEREPDVGWGASKANTSVIHPGHEEDPNKHPIRAKLCAEGNRLWRKWTEELDIPARWPGELMLFYSDEEAKRAAEYVEFARLNGVPGVKMVWEEVKQIEPWINPSAAGAIYAPTAGLVAPFEAVAAIVENAVGNGVRLLADTEVRGIRVSNGEISGVETSKGFVEADLVINAAGLYADRVSHMAGVELDFRIKPRRGEYLLFDENVHVKPHMILHPVPTPVTKGVYAVTTVHGNLMLGPTADDLPEEEKDNFSTTGEGLSRVMNEASKLLKEVPSRDKVIRFFAGLRPEPPQGEWLIKAYDDPWGFVNAAGIRSPGLTAAPAIASYVLELVAREYDVKLNRRLSWNPYRVNVTSVRGKNPEEIDQLVKTNPDYGEIVCRCRLVSKAEIIETVERMRKIGLERITVDGVKFRTTAGMGWCQGQFCRWRISLIISQATGVPLHEVAVKRASYGIGDVKVLLKGEKAC